MTDAALHPFDANSFGMNGARAEILVSDQAACDGAVFLGFTDRRVLLRKFDEYAPTPRRPDPDVLASALLGTHRRFVSAR